MKLILILCISIIVDALWVNNALAWGPAIHTVTALSVLDNVGFILPSIAGIITSLPLEYLYGCLSADFFIGKSRGRGAGRHLHNWEGGLRLLGEAGDDREASYAYGFLSHLAADVVAHNFFVPNVISSYPTGKRVGHVFCEAKADYLVGPNYIRIARDVLAMDHKGCDELLKLITGKRHNRLMAKKRLFTQSVRASDYIYSAHNSLFAGKMIRRGAFDKYLVLMVDLSCRLVRDFLSNPESSPCLSYDPVVRQSLYLARRKGLFAKLYGPRRRPRGFTVDQ